MRRALLGIIFALQLACADAPKNTVAPPPPLPPPPSASASLVDPAPPALRLPTVANPTRYDLDLTIDPGAAKLQGKIAVDLEVLEPTSVLWLNANDISISRASLSSGQKARVIPAKEDFVGFAFDPPLARGATRLTIDYEAAIDHDKARGVYSMQEPSGESYVYTFFEPLDARRAFPCFDEPAYKVPWKLTLHVKKDYVARANSAIAIEKDEANGMKAVEFAESRPLPSYLVAFVVGPFDVVPADDAGHYKTPLRFIVPKGRGDETRYAREVTPKIIGYLEDYFGMQYPYGKLDVAVVPRYWGTMEHPGIVALGQPLTLIPVDGETISRKQSYTDIAAHELAHYWFGDYVTMQWWDETWLNEAMGEWMDAKITDQVDPSWRFGRVRLERAAGAMREDSLSNARRIREPIASNDDIANAFDDITYNKGATVLGMFERWMGADGFQRAIRAYMKAHAWGNATEDDLYSALEAEGGQDIGASMRTFVDQPGVPLVEAKPVCDKTSRAIELSQRRYQRAGTKLQDEFWRIPVCVRYGGKKGEAGTVCTMLSSTSARVPISGDCPTWVLSNDQGTGYYRSKYSKEALAALFAEKSLDDAERTVVSNDAAALVEAGELSLGDAMPFVAKAAAAKDRFLFGSAFSTLDIALRMADEKEREALAGYVRKTFGKKARELGWKKKPGESKDDEAMRPTVLGVVALTGRDTALQKEARDLAMKWLSDRATLDADLVGVALGAGAKTNDAALFDAMSSAAKATKIPRERAQILTALGAFTDPALVKRAEALVLSSDFNLHDTLGIFDSLLGDRSTRDAALTFIDANFDAVRAKLREDEAMWLFYLGGGLCEEGRADALDKAFRARAEKIPGAARVLDGTIEEVRVCAAQARANRASLDDFLKRVR